jgi:hypothetical protein
MIVRKKAVSIKQQTDIYASVGVTASKFADKSIRSSSEYYRPQWLSDLRREFAAARLLELRVRIPPGAWKCVSFECWKYC